MVCQEISTVLYALTRAAIPGMGGTCPSNIWAGRQHTGCPLSPNNLPQNDQVLVLYFSLSENFFPMSENSLSKKTKFVAGSLLF